MLGACLSFKDPPSAGFGANAEIIPFETSLLLAEADHRIANHLSLLMGYVRLKTADMDRRRRTPSRRAMHELLGGIGAQIAAVAKLHRALAFEDLLGSTDLGEHLREVCAPLAGGLSGEVRIVEDLAPGCVVARDQIIPLSQIAAEVITNALKHASDSAEPGVVLVRCQKDADGHVRLEVNDDGEGFPPGFDPLTAGGLGFRLIRGLSQKLGAQITFESSTGGVRFSLTLPPPDPAPSRIQYPEE